MSFLAVEPTLFIKGSNISGAALESFGSNKGSGYYDVVSDFKTYAAAAWKAEMNGVASENYKGYKITQIDGNDPVVRSCDVALPLCVVYMANSLHDKTAIEQYATDFIGGAHTKDTVSTI
ncbi:hypothetical protein HDU96_007084 [Phlyctochytrium bullatum]|nr:hypothetical protein HDU96_007084 [Phlyctochytrium bullatum]